MLNFIKHILNQHTNLSRMSRNDISLVDASRLPVASNFIFLINDGIYFQADDMLVVVVCLRLHLLRSHD